MPADLISRETRPTMKEERHLAREGYQFVAGLDEVGRGCLAGPVAASAVIMPLNYYRPWIREVRDSKFLSPAKRAFLFDKITNAALTYGTGIVSATEIDAIGIAPAVRLAMLRALSQLSPAADSLLIDHFTLPESSLPQWGVANGDSLCHSIACASIVAKVTRDRLMVNLDQTHPGYGLARHKGYATKAHFDAIAQLGLSSIHRRSFCGLVRLPQISQKQSNQNIACL